MNRRPEISQGIDITNWLAQEREKKEAETREAQKQLIAVRENLEASRAKLAARAASEYVASSVVGEPDTLTETQELIAEVCNEYRDFLIAKNRQYGDSAVHPVRVFSKATDEEQLLVRLDDKFSRLIRGNDDIEKDEDIMDDLVGYWLLLKVVRRKAQRADS